MEICHNYSSFGNRNESGGGPFKPIIPSVSGQVVTSLTIFYIVSYCILFISVYIQLWLILYYNYKRFSFQTVFLFLCALWSGLRATLFSFYFKDTVVANELHLFPYWLLYCFPVCLQFFTLCLLNLYFAQVMFKAKSKYAANPSRYMVPLRTACLLAVVIFFVMNISCAVIVQGETATEKSVPDYKLVKIAVTTRVLINDVLFVICAVSLAYCFYKLSKTTSANVLLEAKGTTVCQATSVGILIVLLYASRAIYNLLAISPLRCSKMSSFDFDWYNVSDQADLVNLKDGMSYVVFGIVLFLWELLPTALTIYFFRVRKADGSMSSLASLNGHSRVYFFDNPQRYESEEDLTQGLLRPRMDSQYFATSAPIANNRIRYESYNHPGRLSANNSH